MCNCDNSGKFKELEDYIGQFENTEGVLIHVLHKAQSIFGYLSEEVQSFVAKKLNIPVSKVYGVVTFYSFFNTQPSGKYKISICLGTACFVKGSGGILEEFENQLEIKAGETTKDGLFSLEVVRCLGACGLAPVVKIDDKVYGNFTKDMVCEIIQKYA